MLSCIIVLQFLFYIWLKYKKDNPAGYRYTRYCHYFMVVKRIPGERLYIDRVGDQPVILLNTLTGEIRKDHIFVTSVGFSSYSYAEAFMDCNHKAYKR